MGYGVYKCSHCGIHDVERRKPRGAIPRCGVCLLASIDGRLERQKEKRRPARPALKNGTALAVCVHCGCCFVRRKSETYCEDCAYARKVQGPASKAHEGNQHRKLRRLGLPASWLDRTDISCGICRTNVPGGLGGWHFDHDHRCCKKGCPKCFRGILCSSCNLGLGLFRDDPDRLAAAIEWVSANELETCGDELDFTQDQFDAVGSPPKASDAL